MTAAVVALAATVVVLTVVLVETMRRQTKEHAEWRVERRELINRAIARHAGEVKALDQSAPRPVKPGPLDNQPDRPVPVGL